MPSTSPPAPVLHIRASTLVTSLGDDLLTNVSAYTARKKYFRYHAIDGTKLLTAPARDITGNLQGLQRLNALLQAAWQPMVQTLRDRPLAPTLYLLALPEWLASDLASTTPSTDPKAQPLRPLIDAFSAQCRQLGLPVSAVQAFSGGSDACHAALAQAFRWLAQEPTLQQVVLLAVDSLCDPAILLRDHRANRLYGREQSSGWVPGEAAASILLTRPPTPSQAKEPASQAGLLLLPPGLSAEPEQSPRWPSDMQGDGRLLTQAMQAALQAAELQPQHIGHHVSDSDGSSWRLEDEQAAVDGILSWASNPQKAQWMPEAFQAAEFTGQLGAAWGAVNWALLHGLHQHELITLDRALCTSQDISGRCSANVVALASR
jgi:hypothetical protein